jgi:hypothetical protein
MAIPNKATDWAYLAGFFDGEGTVSVGAVTVPAGMQKANPLALGDGTRKQLRVRFTITNTYRPVLDTFAAAIGAGVFLHTRQRGNRRLVHVLVTQKMASVRAALRGMLPYLREKRERAELVLRYIESRKVGATRRPISEAEVKMYERARDLNRLGIKRSA